MTDNLYARSLASIQSDLENMLKGIMTVNKQEHAKEGKMYEDRKANYKAQRKLIDDKQDKERRDDIKRMEKLEERRIQDQQPVFTKLCKLQYQVFTMDCSLYLLAI